MKLITEYSFRDILGHFVKIQFPKGRNFIDPECDEFIAYVYVDTEAGMTLEIIGGYKDGQVRRYPTSSNKVRYSDDIVLELYDNPDDEMLETAKFIEENYTPDWIGPVRDDERYDPYRDKVFPDDLLIPINTIIDGEREHELLWVRPVQIRDSNLLGITIEPGQVIENNSLVMIVEISDFIENRKFKISGMTLDMIKVVCESDDPQSFFRNLG